MKKLLLAVLLTGIFCNVFAQDETVYYYYQGQKFVVPVSYKKIVVGLKQATSFSAAKNNLFAAFSIKADSVKPTSTRNQFAVSFSSNQQAAAKTAVAGMLKNPLVAYVHPVLAGQGTRLVSYGDGFVVKLKTGASPSQLNSLVAKYHCSITKVSKGDKRTYLISAGAANNYDALKMANTFFEAALFDFAQPDFTTYNGLVDAPNDPLYNLQWAHHNTGSPEQYNGIPGADMQVDSAWTITTGDVNIKIAVIDTGVDSAQADLKKNLLQGYDCINETSNPGDGSPLSPNNAHGTGCAGIIASLANNGKGAAGIAPKCKIIPININSEFDNFASDFSIANGIDYAWQNGADVLTNSWTIGLPSGIIDGAIHRAVTQGRGGKGSVVFFATGNDNAGLSFPAANPDVIAVGGSNMFNQRKTPNSYDGEYWWGASYGAGLDVVAPCVKIATTDISGEHGYNTQPGADGDYNLTFNGTSSAAPHAAGVAALVLSYNKNFSAAEVRNIIESSCTKPEAYTFTLTPGNPDGTWNPEMGYGVVNAYKSLLLAKSKKFCNAAIVPPATYLLCKNASIKLSIADSSAAATFTWRLNGVNTQTANSITASAPGVYDVVAQFNNGCTAYTAGVTLYAADTAALVADAGQPIFLCPGSNGAIIGGTPSAQGGNKIQSTQRAYGYDLLFGSFTRFNTNNPRDYKATPVGTMDGVTTSQFIAGDFTPRGYYAVNNRGELVKIDTATGNMRLIGYPSTPPGQYLSHKWTGLAWNPVDKKLYGLTSGGQVNGIYEIDLFTGKSTLITNIQSNSYMWIAINSNGSMYAFSSTYNRVVRIATINGGVSFTSDDIGVSLLAQLDGSFDPLNGKLYMTTYAVGQGLYGDLREIDTLTGKVLSKGNIGTINEVGALAVSGGTYKYSWAPAAGLSNPNDANPVANPSATTTYTLTVTDACGAKATSKVVVTANMAKPPISIKAEKDSICVGDSTRLRVTKDPNYRYSWTFNGAALTVPNDTVYTAGRGGKFQVTVTKGPGGCTNTAKFTLKDCSIWLKDNNPATTCYSYVYPPYGFVDTGFKPNQNFTKTIYPGAEGTRLKVTFHSFYSGGPSYLTVYDGPNSSSPVLKQLSFYDSKDNMNLSFSSTTGPLTFNLQTGGNDYDIGHWDAFVSCFTPKVYLTKQNGNFEDASTWKVKTGEGTYADANQPPTYAEDSIIIQSGHTVTLNNYLQLVDELWVQKGASFIINGSLQLRNSGKYCMIADGDITITKTGTLYGKCPMIVRGNISDDYPYTYIQPDVFAVGTTAQTFKLNINSFTSLHVLNPAGVIITGPKTTIDSLFMNSMGGLQIDSVNIRNKLILDSGIVHVKSPGVMELTGTKLQVSPGNNKSYVDGAVALSTTYPLVLNYPIGTPSAFRPLSFSFEKFVNDTYIVQALDKPAPSLPLPPGINQVSATSYYSIKALRKYAIPNASITIPYLPGDGVTDPVNLRIVRDSASRWYDAGGVGTGPGEGTITTTNKIVSLNGDIALANATGGTNTLPVTWLQFTAAPQGKNELLQWKVAHEINCDNYTAEYSADGQQFTALAKVKAYNNGNATNSYEYLHKSPLTGINYYRIKETDKDGRFMYSKIISVRSNDVPGYLVTPNPARDAVIVTAAGAIKEIDCYNAVGQLVKKILPGTATYRLSIKELAAGVYNIRVVTAGGVYNTKLIKE